MFLIDSCTLIIVKDEVARKPRWIVEKFDDHPESLHVSALLIWEIEMKAARRPDQVDRYWEPDHTSLEEQIIAAGLTLVPFTGGTATVAARLPPHHKDPFDRGLIGTALHLRLPIISYDRQLARYEGVDLRWD